MRVPRAILAALACSVAACGGGTSAPTPIASSTPAATQEVRGGGVLVVFQAADAEWAPVVHAEGVAGRENAVRFFGSSISGDVRIDMFPDRTSFAAHWRRLWGAPPECWMIASGDPNGITLLSPGAWARETCGHDGQDAFARSRVTFHEVVHVHHARANPSWFATALALGWFVEGLAVHVSGQYGDSRAVIRSETLAGRGPQRLSEVVPAGYTWAGSLVAFIDRRYGRAAVVDLLDDTQEAELLRRLGTSEAELVAAWRSDVAAGH